jgi:hypothetical protein
MNVIQMVRPKLCAARIVYFTDMTRRSAPIVPLGAFGEVRNNDRYGLALKARTLLTDHELAIIGSMLREKLADPFKYLNLEFELAWNEARGRAMDFLARRHTAAISVLAPHVVERRFWQRRWFGEDPLEGRLRYRERPWAMTAKPLSCRQPPNKIIK